MTDDPVRRAVIEACAALSEAVRDAENAGRAVRLVIWRADVPGLGFPWDMVLADIAPPSSVDPYRKAQTLTTGLNALFGKMPNLPPPDDRG